MKRKDLKYYIFILLLLSVVVFSEINKPEDIDWSYTLEKEDKIPYGTFVIFNTLEDVFGKNNIETNKKTVWQYAQKGKLKNKNFIFVSEEFNPDKTEIDALFKVSNSGSDIFIAANRFGKIFSDTLKFSAQYSFFNDSLEMLNFYNKNLKKNSPYKYKKSAVFAFFDSINNKNSEILAYNSRKKPVFFRIKNKNSFIYISSVPETFTNYAVITEKNYEFAYKSLSYLPERKTVWDEYYKPQRKIKKNSLSFIVNNKSLKNAYYLLLISVVVFVFFTAKRRQRIIPEIKQPENKTLEFVKTISRVYYGAKNHKNIAIKEFTYLNAVIKKDFNIFLTGKNEENINLSAEKTGIDINLLKKLLSFKSKIDNLEKISAKQLSDFNKLIEKIYKQIN